MANSLGLYVGLLSHGVGDLLAVIVLLLGFDQLFHRLLQLGLNAAQLIYGLLRKRKGEGGGGRENGECAGENVSHSGSLTGSPGDRRETMRLTSAVPVPF